MTIVFATYHDFTSNSSIQVFSLANCLVELGHDVHVCVPSGKETVQLAGAPKFQCHTYAEALENPDRLRSDTKGPVLIHAWTPRERVRRFAEALSHQLRCHVLVHLEDHEDVVTSAMLGCGLQELHEGSAEKWDALVPDSLSHPQRFRTFLAQATGVTMLINTLGEFVPPGKPSLMFWPAHNAEIFHEMPLQLETRREHGIQDHEFVLVYTGNVTQTNFEEVGSLYLAVLILRRRGHPVRLVRTGADLMALFDRAVASSPEWEHAVVALGQLASHRRIPEVLGMGNCFVQPGKEDLYNDYRFPSKLPEFFAVGRPVLLPKINLGKFVRDGVDAIVLTEGHAMEIAEQVERLIKDPAKAEALAKGALAFAAEHFSWKKAAEKLAAFYEGSVAGPVPVFGE